MREEEGEVIFEFQGPIDPEKIVKFLEWADDEYSVSVVITHAEFEEFATMALAGGAAGAGAALVAKALGPSVSWPRGWRHHRRHVHHAAHPDLPLPGPYPDCAQGRLVIQC